MGEQRDQRQHRHDLELRLAPSMGHLLRQRVKAQVEGADHEDRQQQENQDDIEEDIALSGSGDEHR
ncbi:hypothetical protein D9M72_604420 [compost metagenome]